MEIAILVLTGLNTAAVGTIVFAVVKGAQGLKKFRGGPMGGMFK